MIEVRVQIDAFDSAALLVSLEADGVGAISSFIGLVRSDDAVTAIELEHYPAMTEASLRAIATEAQRRWNLSGAIIVHRVGKIAVGEAIVFVAAASSHRAEAIAACAFLIDRLKTDVPFWKKEFRGKQANWVEAKTSDHARAAGWD
jgi:molybdopterin synthase catalytic subunit